MQIISSTHVQRMYMYIHCMNRACSKVVIALPFGTQGRTRPFPQSMLHASSWLLNEANSFFLYTPYAMYVHGIYQISPSTYWIADDREEAALKERSCAELRLAGVARLIGPDGK
jgi:hypothetical protein